MSDRETDTDTALLEMNPRALPILGKHSTPSYILKHLFYFYVCMCVPTDVGVGN